VKTIELKNISKFFGNVKALEEISLSINEGELISILGPSGCGKTTLLRLIAGLEYPDSGQVEINGVINSIAEKFFIPAEKRNIGMVFQNLALWPHMTVAENIEFGLKIKKLSKNDIKNKVNEVLGMVSLASAGNRYPSELSGGEKQRAALARAVAAEPRLLLLDEPFNSLDSNLRYEIRSEIKDILTRLKITAIFVTHNHEDAVFMSEKIAVMNKGRIEQFDSAENLYLNPASGFVAGFMKGCEECVFNRTSYKKAKPYKKVYHLEKVSNVK
jgi:ABC-type Fe3+/spermidine/putrescine transport system ATPase subunit